jgi:hypothetical protein
MRGIVQQLKPYMRNANALDLLYGNHLYELSVDWTDISPVMKVLYGNRTVLYGIRTFVIVAIIEYEVSVVRATSLLAVTPHLR